MLREQRNVRATLTQWGELDREDRETIVEILAESSLRDKLAEIAIRGRDDAHVNLDGARRTNARDFAFLKHAQQALLKNDAHLADLVEEDRTAAGRLEHSDAILHRASKCAAHVTEQLALEYALGERARNSPR